MGEHWRTRRISLYLLCEAVMQWQLAADFTRKATLTGFEPTLKFSRLCVIRHKHALGCALEGKMQIAQFARIAQTNAVRLSDFVRNL